MKWYQGSIAEAIATSKSKKAVFVVFVEGKDEISQKFVQAIDSPEVSSRLESEDFVAIKLLSDSENYIFFTQIYQLVPVPSIFFIGENGTPFEVVGNSLSASELESKIDSILQKIRPHSKHSSATFIGAEQKAHSSNSNNETNKLSDKTLPAVTSNLSETSDVLSSSTMSTSSNSSIYQGEATKLQEKASPEISHEEKLRRAKELIELQNKKKMEEEERKEREREIERRRKGRDVQKLRQQQQDREIKEAQEQRQREKAADAAAKEKILKQIAEDKLERKKKYEMHLQEKSVAQLKKAQEEAEAQALFHSNDMDKARIQFKLPTGNSITGTFESTTTFSTLRSYVVENAQLPFRHFSMSSFFPRRDFTSVDDNKTLLELELVPTSVILILPARGPSNPSSVAKSNGGVGIFSHFFWTLVAPVVSIYNYFVGYFSGRPRGGESGTNNGSRNPESSFLGSATTAFGRVTSMGGRRLNGQGRTKIRARGNIHTLHSGDNDNDENNTWNGNSTQQM